MPSYLDHTATSLIDNDVLQVYSEALKKYNYNPSSLHKSGQTSLEAMENALAEIAEILDASSDEIIVSSGATESINTAIKGSHYQSRRRNHAFLTFAGEHSATRESFAFLEKEENRGIAILPLSNLAPDLEELEKYLENNKIDFLSTIWVNNETGAISNIEKIKQLKNNLAPQAIFHIDAVQALGKLPISFRKTGADFLSLSLHKIGAPKGIGLLLASKNLVFTPLLHGGKQQRGRRAGTENPALVIASAYALKKSEQERVESWKHAQSLRDHFISAFSKKNKSFRVLEGKDQVPHILSLYIPELRSESLMNVLTSQGFELSIGSACQSHSNTTNPSLRALGLNNEESRHVIRISFALDNKEEEIMNLVESLSSAIQKFGLNN